MVRVGLYRWAMALEALPRCRCRRTLIRRRVSRQLKYAVNDARVVPASPAIAHLGMIFATLAIALGTIRSTLPAAACAASSNHAAIVFTAPPRSGRMQHGAKSRAYFAGLPSARGRTARVRVPLKATAGDDDPWSVLGVPRGSSATDVKRAYRKRALKEHPDVNKAPDATARWQRLSNAYDILSDPEKLRKWEAQQRGQEAGAARGRQQSSSSRGSTWQEPSAASPRSSARDSADFAAVGTAMRGAAAAAVAAAGIAGKAAGYAGRAAQVAGVVGKSVLDNISPSARRISQMKLDELLSFLGQNAAPPQASAPRSADVEQELRSAQQEADGLQEQATSLKAEQEFLERRAVDFRQSGDKTGELDALRRALTAREERKRAKEKLLRCYDRIDSLRSLQQSR
mmetsp:Transcript_37960/g.109539  ORF Transcript_37960/g.109539 Transcript_37960/m.109539 type:complete len:400 (-) Transcript_37960:202-1401(-)